MKNLYLLEVYCFWISNYTAEERRVPEINAALLVHQKSILRNKRVLLAYLNERQSRLRKMRWETGPVLPPQSANNLSETVCLS